MSCHWDCDGYQGVINGSYRQLEYAAEKIMNVKHRELCISTGTHLSVLPGQYRVESPEVMRLVVTVLSRRNYSGLDDLNATPRSD